MRRAAVLTLCMTLLCCARDREELTTGTFVRELEAVRCEYTPITPRIQSFGTISYAAKSDVAATVDGVITDVSAREGDGVERGDVLAMVRNHHAQSQYAQCRATVAAREAALDLAQARLRDGRLEVEARIIAVRKASIELEVQRMDMLDLESSVGSKTELHAAGGITDEALAAVRLEHARATAAYEAGVEELRMLRLGLRDSDIQETGRAVPEAEQDRVDLLKTINTATLRAEIRVAEAGLDAARAARESAAQLLRDLVIRSPRRGVVGAVFFQEGERVATGAIIMTIMDTADVHAVFAVQSHEGELIHRGMRVDIQSDVLEASFVGEVDLVSPVADPQTGTLTIKAVIPNPSGVLRPGMFVGVQVPVGEERSSIVVPLEAAAQRRGDTATVYVVRKQRIFAVEVILGVEIAGQIEVREGLETGDVVVKMPPPGLREGEAVHATW